MSASNPPNLTSLHVWTTLHHYDHSVSFSTPMLGVGTSCYRTQFGVYLLFYFGFIRLPEKGSKVFFLSCYMHKKTDKTWLSTLNYCGIVFIQIQLQFSRTLPINRKCSIFIVETNKHTKITVGIIT